MNTFLKGCLLSAAISFWGPAIFADSAELQTFKNVVLADSEINDGDSFFVLADGQKLHIRLYFADCPEAEIHSENDARRIQEQARYFGIDSPERIPWLGEQAADFTKQVLSQPFTVYTSFARALGGASSHRIYAFVVTSAGRDLSELLVENGFGRSFGVKRERYDGVSAAEVESRMNDMETAAMLGHRGAWSESNPNRIVEYRAEQRAEASTMNKIMNSTARLEENPLDINIASRSDLQRVPGIGPVTASRIIEQRPFKTIDELRNVPGIGAKTMERILPFIRVGTTNSTNG